MALLRGGEWPVQDMPGHVDGRYTQRLTEGQHRHSPDADWVYYRDAHRRHLENAIEPSMCGGDAALGYTVDVAFCHRPSSVICRFVTLVSHAKTAED